MNNQYVFLCNANEKAGLGHFSRCYNIARSLHTLDPRSAIIFHGGFNALALELIKEQDFKFENKMQDEELANKTLILDDYTIPQQEIDRLTDLTDKLVVVDDFNLFDLSKTSLVINFRFEAEAMQYNCRNKCLGVKYFPFHPHLIDIREKNLARSKNCSTPVETLKSILLFIGGNDQFAMSNQMLMVLDEIVRDKHIICISRETEFIDLKNNKLQYLSFTKKIADHYKKADVIISGGGLTKYEAGFCCIPNACVSQSEGQYEDTKILAKAHLTYNLGLAETVTANPELLNEKLSGFFVNSEFQKQLNMMAKCYDAKSSTNIAEAIIRVNDGKF